MDTKTAAQNSLYVILFSQLTSFLLTVITGTVPPISIAVLVLMVLGSLLGGVAGRSINRKISTKNIDRLFIGLMGAIILLCIYNVVRLGRA